MENTLDNVLKTLAVAAVTAVCCTLLTCQHAHAAPLRINLIGTNINKQAVAAAVKRATKLNLGVVLNQKPSRALINIRVNDVDDRVRYGTFYAIGTLETSLAPRTKLLEVIRWRLGCLEQDNQWVCNGIAKDSIGLWGSILNDAKRYCRVHERKQFDDCMSRWMYRNIIYSEMFMTPEEIFSFFIGCSHEEVLTAPAGEQCSIQMPDVR